jgi:hypothetical protein
MTTLPHECTDMLSSHVGGGRDYDFEVTALCTHFPGWARTALRTRADSDLASLPENELIAMNSASTTRAAVTSDVNATSLELRLYKSRGLQKLGWNFIARICGFGKHCNDTTWVSDRYIQATSTCAEFDAIPMLTDDLSHRSHNYRCILKQAGMYRFHYNSDLLFWLYAVIATWI